MKRIRPIGALALCLALTCTSTSALAAPKAATTKPTVKITAPGGSIRGGVGDEITVTPSVPGFLTLKLLTEDGAELCVICENQEVHTKANTIEFAASDAQGNDLTAGTYQISASIVNQYGVESKAVTDTFKVSAPRPSLSDVVITAAKPFTPTVSYTAFFDDESSKDEVALIEFSVYRTAPKAAFVEDFVPYELVSPGANSTNALDLTKDNPLPTAAGYYFARGLISEYDSGIAGERIEVPFVIDESGAVYMLDNAPADVLASVDELVAEIEANTYEAPVEEAPVEEAPVEEAPVEEAPVEEAPVEEAPVEEAPVEEAPVEEAPVEETPVEAPVTDAPAAQSAPAAKPQASAAVSGIVYTAGSCEAGVDGLQIGAGVSDSAGQTDAGYWTLTADATNEEIWQAITRPMMVVNVSEKESAYIYDSPENGRKSLGTVSGITQGLNVIKEREDGWSLVEAYRNEDGAFIRGYIRTNRLRVSEPNTTYGLVIDKKAQTLTVWKDGAPIGSCAVTTGQPTEKYLHRETPAGEYILATRRGTIEYYGDGFSKYTIRLSGNYHLCEIPSTKKNGTDFSKLEGALGTKATRGHICVAHEPSSDGAINAEWIWEMTDTNKRVKVLVLDDKNRVMVPVGE